MPRLHDGMLLDRLLSHRLRKLVEVSADVLGLDIDKTEQVSDWGTAELSERQLHYAALDALAAVRIDRELWCRRWTAPGNPAYTPLRKHLGPDVSPNSGPQLGSWLQQRLDAETLKRWPKPEKTGRLKTDADSKTGS